MNVYAYAMNIDAASLESREPVTISLATWMTLHGVVGAASSGVMYLYQHDWDWSLMTTPEFGIHLAVGFAAGAVTGGLHVASVFLSGPVAIAVETFLSSGVAEMIIEEAMYAIMDNVSTDLLAYQGIALMSPTVYLTIMVPYHAAMCSEVLTIMNENIDDYNNMNPVSSNIVAAGTWSFLDSNGSDTYEIEFEDSDWINFGFDFSIIEQTDVNLTMAYSNGSNAVTAGTGTFSAVEPGAYCATLSSGLYGLNIIETLPSSNDYIVEVSGQTTGEHATAYSITAPDENAGHFTITNTLPDNYMFDGVVNPENGYENDQFTFSVQHYDPNEFSIVQVSIDGDLHEMSYDGQCFTYNMEGSEIGLGQHSYQFIANDCQNPYPAYGPLTFTVSPQPAEGIALSFEETPFEVGELTTIYATITPAVANHPVNFWQSPNMGYFQDNNPVCTNAEGVASVGYYPQMEGTVDIVCVDADNDDVYDISEVDIVAPDHDYTFQTAAVYYSGDNATYSIYDLSIRVYDQGSPVDSGMPLTLTCEQGLFDNNQHSKDFVTISTGFLAGYARLTFTENTTAIVDILFEGGSHSFSFPVTVSVPEMIPVQSIDMSQTYEYNTFDWGADSKSIFYSSEQYKCKERDLIHEEDDIFMNFFNYNGDNSVIQLLRLSPDGSKISFTTTFDFYIFDVASQSQLVTNNDIWLHERRGNMEWISNEKFIYAEGSNDGTRLYTHNGASLSYQQLRDTSWDPYEADFSNNLIVVSYVEDSPHDGLVSVWNHNGSFQYNIDANPGYYDDTKGVAISDDSSILAISDYRDEVIKIYNGSTYTGTTLSSGAWFESKLDWQPGSSRYLLSIGVNNKKVCLWDVENQTMIQMKQYESNADMYQLNWSPNGKLFAVLITDSNPRIEIFSPWDSEAPTVYLPSNNGTINLNESITALSGTAYDENEIELLRYRFDSDPWTDLTITGNSFAIDVSTITEDCTLQILTKDDCLNAETYTYIIDVQGETVPPQISNVSVSDDNPMIGTTILATATVTDNSSGVNPDSVFCIVQQPDGIAQFTLNMHDDGLNGDVTADDTIYSAQIDTATLSETTYYVDIKAEDMYDNEAYSNNAETFYPHDDTQIEITQVTPSTIYYTDEIEITAEITDQNGVLNAILYYNWETTRTTRDIGVNMTSLGSDLFMATLPEQQHPVINYYIEVLDGAQNTTTSATNTLAVNIPPKAPENLLIDLTGNQVVLSWDEVTEDIFNNATAVDEYSVYSAQNPEMSGASLETTTEFLTVTLPISGADSVGFYEVVAEKQDIGEEPTIQETFDSWNSTLWQGNQWSGNSNGGNWVPPISNSNAHMRYNDVSWGQIRMLQQFQPGFSFTIILTPFLASGGGNTDQAYIGLTNNWVYYGTSLGGGIKLYNGEVSAWSESNLSMEVIGSYSYGSEMEVTITWNSDRSLTIEGGGGSTIIPATYLPTGDAYFLIVSKDSSDGFDVNQVDVWQVE